MPKISVVLATYNEEKNIVECLSSVVSYPDGVTVADEIVVVDGSSTDRTREVAKEWGAKVIKTTNPPIFHINKQKALEAATGDWILQLDADEKVAQDLALEIRKIVSMSNKEIENYQNSLPKRELFMRHQQLLEKRDGAIGTSDGDYAAFFIPRDNWFLGKFLHYGGAYPDGVIRLVKKGKAYFPAKSVHEQIVVNGKVGWLQHSLVHMDSPTFARYLEKNSRYIDLVASELKRDRVSKSPVQVFNYFLIKPLWWFLLTQVRHKGILDGFPGIVFSFFSALRFPKAYWRYITKK